MTRIQLRMYVQPGMAEISCNIKHQDGNFERTTAVVDTGAQVSLFPEDLLPKIEHRLIGKVEVEQAGLFGQSFVVTEALLTVFFEDQQGH